MSEVPNQHKKPPRPKEAQGNKPGGKGGRRKSVSKNEAGNKDPVILQNPQNGSKHENANPAKTRQGGNHKPSPNRAGAGDEGYHRHHVEDGMYPNPWWRTLTTAELRWQKLYRALPPAEDLARHDGTSWTAFLRQDTELFDQLIQGRLSARQLLAVLGCQEASAARKLNLPHSMVGHAHAVEAVAHLSKPVNELPEPNARPTGEPHDEESAAKKNRMLVLKYNSGCTPYTAVKAKPPSRAKVTAEECPGDIGALREAWSVEQNSSGLYALGAHNPHGMVEECGLTIPELPGSLVQQWGFSEGELPPLASAPMARLKTTRNRDAVEKLVLIKNVCPFVWDGSHGRFAREHRIPNDMLQPWWLPGLQWELFFEGIDSACVVSQSATRGMNIFTVHKDDQYVRLILELVRKFYQQFVLTGNEPPINFLFDTKEHNDFIQRTLKMAAQFTTGFERVQTVRRAVKRQPFFIDRPLNDSDEEDEDEEQAAVPSEVQSIADALPEVQGDQQPQQAAAMNQQPGMQGMQGITPEVYNQMMAQMMAQQQQMMAQMYSQISSSPQAMAQVYGMYPQYGMQMNMGEQQPMAYQQPQQQNPPMASETTNPNNIPETAMSYDQMMAQLSVGAAAEHTAQANAQSASPSTSQPIQIPTVPKGPAVAKGPSADSGGFRARTAPMPAPAPAPKMSEREAALLELQRLHAQPNQPATTFGSSPWGASPQMASGSYMPGADVCHDKPGDDAVWGGKPAEFENMVDGMLDMDD